MPKSKISDEQFIALFNEHRSPVLLAKITGLSEREVYRRRTRIEKTYSVSLISNDTQSKPRFVIPENKIRAKYTISDGIVMIGSDCHYNHKYITTAHRAFVHLISVLKPKMIVLNGDIFDFAQISQHHRIGYQEHPTVQQELEEVQARLGDIEAVRPAGCILHRTIGNHDLRFDGKLSNVLPQYEKVHGMALADHLPGWSYSWSVMVNSNTVIKHRWHNGIHAVYNNVLKGGMSIFTGHLHSLKVTPWTNYTGDLYGVDTGMMASVKDDQFMYHEDSSVNWRAGFAIATYINGNLMPPELCQVINEDEGLIFFRGELYQV